MGQITRAATSAANSAMDGDRIAPLTGALTRTSGPITVVDTRRRSVHKVCESSAARMSDAITSLRRPERSSIWSSNEAAPFRSRGIAPIAPVCSARRETHTGQGCDR